jgi:hypothetical protein
MRSKLKARPRPSSRRSERRRRRDRSIALVAAALLLAGCASATRATDNVRIVRNASHVKFCAPLGEVSSVGWSGIAADGYEETKGALRRETADRGGNTLLILGEQGSVVSRTVGEAYRCTR